MILTKNTVLFFISIFVLFISINVVFSAEIDTTPPLITNVQAINMFSSGAQITWNTDDASNSRVAYGTSPDSYTFFSDWRCDGGGDVTNHCINLVDLSLNTVYYLKVESTNTAGLDSFDTGYSFISSSSVGGDGPSTVPSNPSNIVATISGSNNNDVDVTWFDNSSDENDFKLHRRVTGGMFDFLASISSNTTTYTDSSVPPGSYEYMVVACNSFGCSSMDSNYASVTVTEPVTPPPDDTTAPTISSVTASSISSNDASITWTTDEQATSQVYYGVDSINLSTTNDLSFVTSHSVSLSGLSVETTYMYYVVSVDASGNMAQSGNVTFTTYAASTSGGGGGGGGTPTINDTTPPIIEGVQAINKFGDGAQIEWTTDEPANSKVNYGTSPDSYTFFSDWRCDDIGLVTSHCVYLSGLTHDTTYYYKAESDDLSGNTASSNEYSFIAGSDDSGTTPPTTTEGLYVDYNKTFPQDGDFGIGTNETIHIEFNKDIDVTTVGNSTFIFTESATPSVALSGTFNTFNKGFDFIPASAMTPETNYVYKVFPAVVAIDGSTLFNPYLASFTTAGGATEVSAKMSGLVTDFVGNPVANAFVEIHTSDWTSSRGGQTDINGNYTVLNIPPGSYIIDIFPPSSSTELIRPQSVSITFVAGEARTENFQFQKATKTIRGQVLRNDGSIVTDARVEAFQPSTNQWTDTHVGSSGNYKLFVTSGTWEVRVSPDSDNANWTYDQASPAVTFINDSTTEEQIVNFIVVTTESKIIGVVLLPNGTPPPTDTIFISFRNSAGQEFSSSISVNGSFDASVTEGIYQIFIYSNDQKLQAPSLSTVVVNEGEIKNLGTINLISKNNRIIGTVVDEVGEGINNVRVSSWMPEGEAYAYTTTDSTGFYELLVTSGIWEVNAEPGTSLNLYNPDPPQRVTVEQGVMEVVVNFKLLSAEAGIAGTVVDETGVVLSDVYGFAELAQSTSFEGGIGGPIERGVFSFKAPAGTYMLRAFFSPDTPYTAGTPQTVVLVSGKTINTKLVVSKNTSKIIGTLKDETGATVTGFNVHISATAGSGIWKDAIFDQTTGTYTLNVSSGTWYLGYDLGPDSGFVSSFDKNIAVDVPLGATVVKNLIVKKAGSIIKGQVTDPLGNGVFGAFVGVSKSGSASSIESDTFKDPTIAGADTDTNGFYMIAVPAGSYFVKTFVNPDRGFINSEEKQITVTDGETLVVSLKLRKAILSITGSVFIDADTLATNAFVWGWSEKGGYQEASSNFDGSFKLNITDKDVWVVAASAVVDGVKYKSNEIAVDVLSSNVSHDIYLERFEALPPPVVEVSDATAPVAVSFGGGGSTVVASGNSISTTGSVTISISPDMRAPSQGEIKVIGTAYDIEARDSAGQIVSSFNTDVTITLEYDDAEVKSLGTIEDNLRLSFWDETASTWKIIENSIVNKEDNLVTAAVNHFTRFAIIAAADFTPPEAPTGVTGIAIGSGIIELFWTNPTSDFGYIKIYRSEVKDKLGIVLASEVAFATFADNTVKNNVTYYYTVRAVDSAGNETNNTNQVSVTAIGTGFQKVVQKTIEKTLPKGQSTKLQILRNLTVGSTGADVTSLQQFLLDEGVYPEGLITGYFGSLTKQAVIRFQEKYAEDILFPVGLSKGSGFVGPSTRKKLNTMDVFVKGKSSVSGGQSTKLQILRNLTVGSTGADVTSLQQFLLDEGVYPEGLITGYFGSLTKQAVIRFQDKYSSEILAPVGLTKGTGFFGPSTRKKVNALLK